jgi:hypothetical protein
MTIAINKIKIEVDKSDWTAGGWLVQYSHDAMNDSESAFVPFARVCEHLEADDNAQVIVDNRKIDVQDYIEDLILSGDKFNEHLAKIINEDQGRNQYYAKPLSR